MTVEANPVEGYYSVPRPRGNRTVTLAMFVSFGIFLLAGPSGVSKLSRVQRFLVNNPTAPDPGVSTAKHETGADVPGGTSTGTVLNVRSIFGWATLFVMLTVLADFEPTSELAGSFATLILLTTLLALGPDALANVGRFIEVSTK